MEKKKIENDNKRKEKPDLESVITAIKEVAKTFKKNRAIYWRGASRTTTQVRIMVGVGGYVNDIEDSDVDEALEHLGLEPEESSTGKKWFDFNELLED